jgi:hypothetical protein
MGRREGWHWTYASIRWTLRGMITIHVYGTDVTRIGSSARRDYD